MIYPSVSKMSTLRAWNHRNWVTEVKNRHPSMYMLALVVLFPVNFLSQRIWVLWKRKHGDVLDWWIEFCEESNSLKYKVYWWKDEERKGFFPRILRKINCPTLSVDSCHIFQYQASWKKATLQEIGGLWEQRYLHSSRTGWYVRNFPIVIGWQFP